MGMQTRGSTLASWLVGIALVAAAGPALALNNWELGQGQFAAECTACHNLPGVVGGGKENFPAGQSATTVQGKINAGMRGLPDPLATANAAIINDTVSNIAAYLSKTTFPLATLSPLNVAFPAVSVDLTRTQTFRLTNTGTDTLTVIGIAVSDNTNYSVPAGACPSVTSGSFCEFDVTFAPQSPNTFSGRTLTVSHNTFAASSSATLGGTGLVQFSVAPTALSFTPATAPTGVLQVTVTDNKGVASASAVPTPRPSISRTTSRWMRPSRLASTVASPRRPPRPCPAPWRWTCGSLPGRSGRATAR